MNQQNNYTQAPGKSSSRILNSIAAWLVCVGGLFGALFLITPAVAQISSESLDARWTAISAESLFPATELRDATGLSLRSWFAYFGDAFPLNIEVVESPNTGGLRIKHPTPKWPGLIISSGDFTLPQIISISTERLGAVVHDNANGTNLIFKIDSTVSNPFDSTLKNNVQGTFDFEQALIALRGASEVDLSAFSSATISGRKQLALSVPSGTTLRSALNTITRAWGCHWSAAIIGHLEGSAFAKAVNPGHNSLVTVQFFFSELK
jgi:hypothetical protein